MTLKEWFFKKTKTPLMVLGLFVGFIYCSFVLYAFKNSQVNLKKSLNDLIITSVRIGIQQNNRDLVESTLARAVDTLGAHAAILCNGQDLIVATTYDLKTCLQIPPVSFFHRLFKVDITGFSGYTVYFHIPWFSLSASHLWLLILTFSVVLICGWIIVNLRKNFLQDILLPLESNFISEDIPKIRELAQIKSNLQSLGAAREYAAYIDAVLESKRTFAHNVKSPIRAMKLLRQKLALQIDRDDMSLLENALDQISNMADKITIKQSRLTQERHDCSRLAQVDLRASLIKHINSKMHELLNAGKKINIKIEVDESSHYISVIDEGDFGAVISNLLNNAAEAQCDTITVKLFFVGARTVILISDNGKGIPTALSGYIFEDGATHGKPSGSGFGLYHVKRTLEAWKGSVNLLVENKSETVFRLEIPRIPLSRIDVKPTDSFIILDDNIDERKRIRASLMRTGLPNEIAEFDSPLSFNTDIKREDLKNSDLIIFADFDFGPHYVNGIEAISSFKSSWRSFLVTDHHDDPDVFARCKTYAIPLLPKEFFQDCISLHFLP
ncbi:MAG: HAMP domain-containing histidine kinase [Bdellovibrionales bacterium]|nr:HAMP domain-containing histidine kinase [Bdellovibrionales bacterium]